jgi:hypothetical protein
MAELYRITQRNRMQNSNVMTIKVTKLWNRNIWFLIHLRHTHVIIWHTLLFGEFPFPDTYLLMNTQQVNLSCKRMFESLGYLYNLYQSHETGWSSSNACIWEMLSSNLSQETTVPRSLVLLRHSNQTQCSNSIRSWPLPFQFIYPPLIHRYGPVKIKHCLKKKYLW